jgi:hypothetical protein
MLLNFYLLQQTFDIKDAIRYSIGLTIICLLILILLWLPDILKEK